jgi:hypothetical protein
MKCRGQGSWRITPEPQADKETCWLACYKMLYQVMDEPVSDVERKLKDAGIDITTTLPDDKQIVAADALGLKWTYGTTISSYEALVDMINNYGVLKVSVFWGGRTAHAIVVTGYEERLRGEKSSPVPSEGMPNFGFINPWMFDQGDNAQDVKERWSGYPVLKKGVIARGVMTPGLVQYCPY